ncbi:MAG: aquaporin [Cyanobacteria bacterium RUI128]|nr:aquaporin [Cyanobacteria bacterium RUI128]
MKELLKKCLVEFIGTFFLVLTVGCTVFTSGDGVIPAIAIGLILAVMVYAGGHVSGGHYNPAVSLAAAIRGALDWKDIAPYWIAQLLGGAVAACAVLNLVTVPAVECEDFNLCSLILFELLFTFALCYVVLHTATSKDTEGNSYYGFAIGGTVLAGAFASAGICYGAFNPAVALGLLTMSAASAKIIGITALTNLVGGALAALVYKITNND